MMKTPLNTLSKIYCNDTINKNNYFIATYPQLIHTFGTVLIRLTSAFLYECYYLLLHAAVIAINGSLQNVVPVIIFEFGNDGNFFCIPSSRRHLLEVMTECTAEIGCHAYFCNHLCLLSSVRILVVQLLLQNKRSISVVFEAVYASLGPRAVYRLPGLVVKHSCLAYLGVYFR